MTETKIVLKNAYIYIYIYIYLSEAKVKGKETDQDSSERHEEGSFGNILIVFHLLI